MNYKILQRIQAIRRRIAGETVSALCRALGRSRQWFYRWWRRFQHHGPSGLADDSHRPNTPAPQISAEVEQAIVGIRQRLSKQRYVTIGAPSIARELEFLGV